MGRYPWITCTRRYLEATQPYYAPKTHRTTRSGLKALGDMFGELKAQGKIRTVNPELLGQADIEALLEHMKVRKTRNGNGLRPSTQANYLLYLRKLLLFVENPTMERMIKLRYVRFPKKTQTEVQTLSPETVEEIRSRLEDMPGWEGSVARFMLAVFPYSGARRSELMLTRIQDLDTEKWELVIVHPKGEDSYASAGVATILPRARETVMRFLEERREFLAEHRLDECEPLVPFVRRSGEVTYWTEGMWGKVKDMAQEWTGIKFNMRILRASFGQMSKDRGASIESVSRAMRHGSTRTTELYYARIRPKMAFRELEQAWAEKPEPAHSQMQKTQN